MLRIVLVEDQQILRDSLSSALNEIPDIEVQVSLSNSDLLVETFELYHPDLVIMDICIGDESGIEATARLKESYPKAKVLLMTGMMDIGFVNAAKTAGADSFVYKNTSIQDLASTIKRTFHGDSIYPSDIPVRFPNDAVLSDKEISILRLVCMEYSRKEISEKLNMSENTIRNYINRILDKTGYENIARLAIFAIANGYISQNKEEDLDKIYQDFYEKKKNN